MEYSSINLEKKIGNKVSKNLSTCEATLKSFIYYVLVYCSRFEYVGSTRTNRHEKLATANDSVASQRRPRFLGSIFMGLSAI